MKHHNVQPAQPGVPPEVRELTCAQLALAKELLGDPADGPTIALHIGLAQLIAMNMHRNGNSVPTSGEGP